MGFGRAFLYHRVCPEGKIFTDEVEFNQALKDGWVEAPWLVNTKEELDPEKAKEGPLKPRKKRGFDLSPLEE